MAKRTGHERTEETAATEEPASAEEGRRVIADYISDLQERIKKLRRLAASSHHAI
jgi:hypothetical protein